MFDNQQKIKKNNSIIFLIGFMGSGKTTLGKALSEKLNYSFIDSDNWIEQNEHLTVSKMFEVLGEEKFRELELNFIEHSKKLNNVVIATGGGLPCNNSLIDSLLKIGKVFYLKTSEEVLLNRLENDVYRPLISGLNSDEKYLFISKKLKEREKFYNQADIIIDATKSIKELTNQIQCQLS